MVAVKTVCKSLYNHEFYITKVEAIEKDPSLADYKNEDDAKAPEQKRPRLQEEVTVKAPPTKKDEYLPYKNVLPTPKTLTDHKHCMACQCFVQQAQGMIHYDTTSWCKIDGEWPAIILNFASKNRFFSSSTVLCIRRPRANWQASCRNVGKVGCAGDY